MKTYLQLLGIILIATSCASSYKPIKPRSINYQTNLSSQSIAFSYKYGVLSERGNKKYAKRETLKAIKLVAVKVTNNSDQPLVFGQDLKFYSNGNPVNLLEPKVIHQNLKQGVPIYLLYLLLTPMQFNSGDESTPIGLVIGPGIAIGNMVGAGAANSNFLKELQENYLIGRTIEAGETSYGIIGIYDTGFSPLTLEAGEDIRRSGQY